jgi:hypothetical protein
LIQLTARADADRDDARAERLPCRRHRQEECR